MKTYVLHFVTLAFVLVLTPSLTYAVTPKAMLEKSATYAFDGTVRGYRVPTVDSTGKIKYFDVIIDLNVNASGIISPTANVLATASISIPSIPIVPGNYKVEGSTTNTCVVTTTTLTNGRIQAFLTVPESTVITSVNSR